MRVTKSSQKSINLISNSIILCVLSFLSIFVATSAHAAMGDLVQTYIMQKGPDNYGFAGYGIDIAATDERVLVTLNQPSATLAIANMYDKQTGEFLRRFEFPVIEDTDNTLAITSNRETFFMNAPLGPDDNTHRTIYTIENEFSIPQPIISYPAQITKNAESGQQITANGDLLLFALPGVAVEVYSYPGMAYLYQGPDYSPNLTFSNPVFGPESGSEFATSLDLSQTHALISNPSKYANRVYLYDLDSKQLAHAFSPPAISSHMPEYNFGRGNALLGNNVIIGSPDSRLGSSNGVVFLFDINTFELIRTIKAPSAKVDGFGISITTVGDYFIVGSSVFGDNSFSIYDNNNGRLILHVQPPTFETDDSLIESLLLPFIDSDDQNLYISAIQTITDHSTGNKSNLEVVYQYEIPEPASLSTLLAASLLILHRRPPHPLHN